MTRDEICKYIDDGAYESAPTFESSRELMADLVELYNLNPRDPNVHQAYAMAFSNGHLYGYYEILCHFEDLLETLKETKHDT